MKQNLTRSLTRLRDHLHVASRTGQKVVAIVGTAALLLAGVHGVPLGRDAQLRAALQQPRLRGRLRGRSTSSTPRACPTSSQQRQHDHGAARPGLRRPGSRSAARACPAASERRLLAARRPGHLDLASSRSRPTSSGRWRASSPRPSRPSTASTPPSCTWRCPPKKVFADEQDPTTASVLVDTAPGTTMAAEQVQAVVNLVASSIDGLDPEQGHRRRLQAGCSPHRRRRRRRRRAPATSRSRTSRTQIGRADPGHARPGPRRRQLHRPGHRRPRLRQGRLRVDDLPRSTRHAAALVEPTSTEKYAGPAGGSRLPPASSAPTARWTRRHRRRRQRDSSYTKESTHPRQRRRRPSTEHRETAPGSVNSLHVGVVLDTAAAQARSAPPTSRT